MFVESIEKELVVRSQQVGQESIERGARRFDLASAHAAAGVEHDPEADRHALGAEVGDLDRLIVFVNQEIALAETGDEAARRVGHRRGDVDELDAGVEPGVLLTRHTAVTDEQRGGRRAGERGSAANLLVRHGGAPRSRRAGSPYDIRFVLHVPWFVARRSKSYRRWDEPLRATSDGPRTTNYGSMKRGARWPSPACSTGVAGGVGGGDGDGIDAAVAAQRALGAQQNAMIVAHLPVRRRQSRQALFQDGPGDRFIAPALRVVVTGPQVSAAE